MLENYYLLFTAILLQAEKDFFSADDKTRRDAIRFIMSDDFYYLSGVEGEIILSKLENGEIQKPTDVLDKAYWNSDPMTIWLRMHGKNNRTKQKTLETDTEDRKSNGADPG